MSEYDYIVYVTEEGDWTVLYDPDLDAIIYSGHDTFSSLIQALIGFVGMSYNIVILTQQQMEEKF